MLKTFRKWHRKIAPILFLPLFLTALTGVAYRIGRKLGIPPAVAEKFMALHEGRFLGQPLVPIYVLLVGLGLVGLVVTGLVMIWRRPAKARGKKDWRWTHRLLATVGFLPLLLSATTGMAYRLGMTWFGLSPQQGSALKAIHEGAFLGSTLKLVYVLMVGGGLIALLITGIQMMGMFRKRKSASLP